MSNHEQQKWHYAAGSKWEAEIDAYAKYNGDIIYQKGESQKQDLIVDWKDYTLYIECKAKDLHSSLFAKGGIAASFDWEMAQHYLPYRKDPEGCDEIWVLMVLSENTTFRDLETLASKCHEHRIPHKLYESHRSALHDLYLQVCALDDPIDLSLPQYINMSDQITQLDKMLRIFPGMTGEMIDYLKKKYYDRAIAEEKIIPEMFFSMIHNLLPAGSNLQRLWIDWWYSGIEPKENTLSKKKITKRKG